MSQRYESPLSSRYASEAMLRLFSPDTRYSTWRKLWVSLARAEQAMGLPITTEQVEQLAAHTDTIDYEAVAKKEREIRHDVMAHVYAFGLDCPNAKGIIHLGATSCFVTDNADLIILRQALRLIENGLLAVQGNLSAFAARYKALPALGYTHYQPAQPVTLGKRACLWLQDLLLDQEELTDVTKALRFLGCRGATGTEASFLALFDGDGAKIDQLNHIIAQDFGFAQCYEVCGQTYPRKLDSRILGVLSSIAQSAAKFANDVRLLQHDRQLFEPFETEQVGSSAMAYKRNPMRCERICSLSRYVLSLLLNPAQTASVQWLERTLDDSANRRLCLAEAFLATDAILRLMANVTKGLVVNEPAIARALWDELPFLATENMLMAAVKAGGDRQACHEIIRRHSMESRAEMENGQPCDLIQRLSEDPDFPLDETALKAELDPARHIGRSVEQVERFLAAHPLEQAKPLEEISL